MDYDNSRRQQRRQPDPNPYTTPFPNQFNVGPYYEQSASPQLFEDLSGSQPSYAGNFYQDMSFPPANAPGNFNAAGGPGYSAGNLYNPNAYNQQMLMGIGSQILQNQIGAAANFYSQDIVNKGRSWIGQNLKYYFAVDTSYVIKKLIMIFFPFTHKDWTVKYVSDEPIAPRDDVNAPDLYIPSMAFLTYVLVAGYTLGLQSRFSPEQLGIQSSFAFFWLFLEVIIISISLYLLSLSSAIGFFHLVAFSSYKYVCIIVMLISGMLFSHVGYYAALIYSSISLCFFLMRSLHVTLQTNPTPAPSYNPHQHANTSTRNPVYLVLIICLVQPILMYWLTRHLVIQNPVVRLMSQ